MDKKRSLLDVLVGNFKKNNPELYHLVDAIGTGASMVVDFLVTAKENEREREREDYPSYPPALALLSQIERDRHRPPPQQPQVVVMMVEETFSTQNEMDALIPLLKSVMRHQFSNMQAHQISGFLGGPPMPQLSYRQPMNPQYYENCQQQSSPQLGYTQQNGYDTHSAQNYQPRQLGYTPQQSQYVQQPQQSQYAQQPQQSQYAQQPQQPRTPPIMLPPTRSANNGHGNGNGNLNFQFEQMPNISALQSNKSEIEKNFRLFEALLSQASKEQINAFISLLKDTLSDIAKFPRAQEIAVVPQVPDVGLSLEYCLEQLEKKNPKPVYYFLVPSQMTPDDFYISLLSAFIYGIEKNKGQGLLVIDGDKLALKMGYTEKHFEKPTEETLQRLIESARFTQAQIKVFSTNNENPTFKTFVRLSSK